MTTIKGTLLAPDGTPANGTVTYHPVGTNGTQLRDLFLADGTRVGESRAPVTNGTYLIDVPGNADALPAGTRYKRIFGRSVAVLEVPAQLDLAVSASARSANVVTLTVGSGHGITAGMLVTTDVATASFDGTFEVTSTTATTILYSQTGADESGGAGTVARGYREHEILADEPGALQSPALSLHAADEQQHGGGVELAHTQITTDVSTTLDAATDIATISFVVPDRPYEVEAEIPMQASVAGVIVYLEIINVANSDIIVDQWFLGGGANDKRTMELKFRVPTARANHAPAAGSTITYKLRLWRTGGAGTASSRITGFGVPVRDAYLSAKTR